MKKLITILIFFCIVGITKAQDFQLLSNGSSHIGTVELFKPLDYGHVYYFTDFKLDRNGIHEAYGKIADYWTITKFISLTAQIESGISFNEKAFQPTATNHLGNGFHLYPVYLGGVSKDFTIGKTFNLTFDVMYRHQTFLYVPTEDHNGYQISMSFSQDMKKIQTSGYCDFWNTKYFMFEPQAWYKLFKRVWVGLEWRVSNYQDVLDTDVNGNPSGTYANYVMFGIKWNLE
jgi:Domain of unknown function (DUF5020)